MTKETINQCDKREKNFGTGKKKIQIERIDNKKQKSVAFSKRRMGLFKKADQYRKSTGCKIAAIAFSPAGHLYTTDGGDGTSVDEIVDNYLSLAGLPSTRNGLPSTRNEDDSSSSSSDAAKLTGWILDEIIAGEKSNGDDPLAMKALLEMIKQEVDNRITC
ncbi:MADS-box transcription factor 51-like [Impatiens glandulifera]|uniref:MADS-box transcription factor 51-like n=1 Tax=Impatiens glandulifera TaxID=253017 RepID=UPI001FB1A117|nr:MADS-box transcription factor 51-like [Impatiens glandulifera]XP_047320629.1 MADS-box transcription factor 51-like [Impatiens glandulifera]